MPPKIDREEATRELLEVAARLAEIGEENTNLLARRAELFEILVTDGVQRVEIGRMIGVSAMVVTFALDRLEKKRAEAKAKTKT